MEKIKFIAAQNEIQRIYSDFGLIVPVGDLDEGHAPSIKPLPSSSTTDSVTASFNIISNADITSLSYKVNDGEAVSVTPQKGVVTITLNDLEYNSGPYTIEITAVNETGSTSAKSTTDLQTYTDWAEPESVLAGNKFIANGVEMVGEIVTKTATNVTFSDGNVNVPVGYYAEQVTKEYPVPVLETVPVTPTTSAQTITPSTGYDGIGQVNVSAVTSSIDANITAGNIKNGVTILGVTGTMTGGPTDGGAVVSSVEIVDPGGGLDCEITFTTMPTIDTANHIYAFDVIAYSYCNSGQLNGHQCYNSLTYNSTILTIDAGNLKVTIGDVYTPQDQYGDDMQSTSGYILVYEDGYDNLIYKIPCTITNPSAI